MTSDPGPIERLRESLAFESRYASLYNDDVRWRSGVEGTYVRLISGSGQPGVVVVPVNQGMLGLVRVYRYPLGSWQWGFPRGFGHSADVFATAAAELREEMGIEGRMEMLGWFSPDSGIQAGRVAAIAAYVDDVHGAPEDTDEVDDVTWLDPGQLLGQLGRGEFDDGMTMSALILAMARGIVRLPGPIV